MSVRTIMAAAALVVAPLTALYAQAPTRQDSAAHRTWNVPMPTRSPTPTTQNPVPPAQPQQARAAVLADSAIVRQALAANLLEVQLGQLAQGRSANAAVQQFASRMVGDHTAMQNQWASLAAKSALPPTATLDASQSLTVRRLGGLSGAGFDRAFVAAMVQNHQQDAQVFQRVSTSAQSLEVRQLASNGLGTIQQHLGAARQLQTQIATTDVAAVPPTTTTAPSRQAGPQGYRSDNDDMKADRDFVHEVAADHRMQVQLAQLAEKKARNADVKRFARQMADDFSKWQSRWDDVGAKNGMSTDAGLGRLHREKVDRMEKANGKNADKAYLAAVIENIESLLPYFQKEGRDVHSSQVRDLVNSELPVLRQRLAEARRLQG